MYSGSSHFKLNLNLPTARTTKCWKSRPWTKVWFYSLCNGFVGELMLGKGSTLETITTSVYHRAMCLNFKKPLNLS